MTRSRPTRPESSAERFFLRQPLQLATASPTDSVELEGSEAHHLLHVLRASVGDQVGLFNGEGVEALAEIVAIKKRSATLRITKAWIVPEDARGLVIATALPKGDRARWLIEKATELGVSQIIPLRTARSIVEPGESKLDKLEQAVITACKQCGRSRLMQIAPLTSLSELLASPAMQSRLAVIGDPSAQQSVAEVLSTQSEDSPATLAFIGPEGGFTSEEVNAAIAAGAKPVRLSTNILRIETAAVVIASVWQVS